MAGTTGNLTIAEAARRIGVSKVTVRRALDAGRFPNAIREEHRGDGRWLIPWRDIEQSGLIRASALVARPEPTRQPLELVVEMQARTIERQAEVIETLVHRLAQRPTGIEVEGGDPHGS